MLTLGVRMLAVHQTFVEGKPVWLLYTRTVSEWLQMWLLKHAPPSDGSTPTYARYFLIQKCHC